MNWGSPLLLDLICNMALVAYGWDVSLLFLSLLLSRYFRTEAQSEVDC